MRKLFLPILFISLSNTIQAQNIEGCTDRLANNFNSNATVNDGSCTYNNTSVALGTAINLSSKVKESSGLLYHNGLLYTHNDNDNLYLYAIDTTTGDVVDSIYLNGLTNKDWEAIGQDQNYIYIADFGNNVSGNRENLKIYTVAKNTLGSANPTIDSIQISYSNQTNFAAATANNTAFDAEAFVVTEDTLIIFTKNWINNSTEIYFAPKTPGVYAIDSMYSFNVNGLVTDAYIHPTKKLITLLGYNSTLAPFVYLMYDWTAAYNFETANRRKINITGSLILQSEGIYSHDGMKYWISSEEFSRSGINFDANIRKIDLTAYTEEFLNRPTEPDTETSIQNLNADIKVYPNPTNGVCNIYTEKSLSNMKTVTVVNMLGQTVELPLKKVATNHYQIDITQLNKDVYHIMLKNELSFRVYKN